MELSRLILAIQYPLYILNYCISKYLVLFKKYIDFKIYGNILYGQWKNTNLNNKKNIFQFIPNTTKHKFSDMLFLNTSLNTFN